MPVYNLIESPIKQARGGADLPMLMTFCVRLVYVVLVTLVAVVIPFFGALPANDAYCTLAARSVLQLCTQHVLVQKFMQQVMLVVVVIPFFGASLGTDPVHDMP
jgi:hypothetical protein